MRVKPLMCFTNSGWVRREWAVEQGRWVSVHGCLLTSTVSPPHYCPTAAPPLLHPLLLQVGDVLLTYENEVVLTNAVGVPLGPSSTYL